MSKLHVTLIDVGWGDSLLVESEDQAGHSAYGLVDSNDTKYLRSSMIFLKRFFEKKGPATLARRPLFDFVLLTHSHADHGQGLKPILQEYGTRYFWHPKSVDFGSQSYLLTYARRSNAVAQPEALNSGKPMPSLGDAAMSVLWPPWDVMDPDEENNNSVVLALTLGQVTFVLTGDAEGPVWDQIAAQLPAATRFFKVPHHGSENATFHQGGTPWLDRCATNVLLGTSSHVRPFSHPHPDVVQEFANRGFQHFRTDLHYHVTVSTDGTNVEVKYSH